jgi:hypothetical protein
MEEPTDREFIEYLTDLKERDYHAFMCLVLESLTTFPDLAAEDDAPIETKLSALSKVLAHFESREDYEICATVRDITEQIKTKHLEHGEKG